MTNNTALKDLKPQFQVFVWHK